MFVSHQVRASLDSASSHRYRQLDGIRGMAILPVLIWHYTASKLDSQTGPIANSVKIIFGTTWSGVDLFFVLSGFLIGGILLDNRDAPNYYKAFYTRRICRIFPLYFGWLLVFLVVAFSTSNIVLSDPLKLVFLNLLPLWSYFTFTQNIAMVLGNTMGADWLGITWSLAVEEQFYLVLPFIIRLVPMRRLPYLLVTLIVAAPMLRLLQCFIPPHSTFPNNVLMPLRADALLLGVLSAQLLRQPNTAAYLQAHIRSMYVALTLLLGGVALYSFISTSPADFFISTFGYSWLALLYTCLILIAMIEKRGIISWLTKQSWLCSLGVLAYGIYMLHQGINGLAHALILNRFPSLQMIDDYLVTAVALLVTILLAYVSWIKIEKRVVALGHSVNYEGFSISNRDAALSKY